MHTVKAKKTFLQPLMLRACRELLIAKELAGYNPIIIAIIVVDTSMVVEGVVKEGGDTKGSEGGIIQTSGTRVDNSRGATSSKNRDHCLLRRWTTVPVMRKPSNHYHSDREMAAAIPVRMRLMIGQMCKLICRWRHNHVIVVLIFTVILYCLIVFLCN